MTGIIIQARMGSTRLPGKVLMNIGNKSLLEHIFSRLKFLEHSAKIVLATSTKSKDDIIAEFCATRNIECFRGDEQNVLQRYYLCAQQNRFQNIVRLTGDNPFTDIQELDRLIHYHSAEYADYTHSFGVLPIGVGAEIVTFGALERSYYEGTEPQHLEHVNEYILENPAMFKISTLEVSCNKRRPDIRLTVDTLEDYQKACYIVNSSSADYVTTEEAIKLCLRYV